MTEDEERNLYLLVGQIVVTWAYVESALDMLISLIHHVRGGRAIQAEVPRSLDNKTAYLKSAHKLGLVPSEDLLGLALAITAIQDRRHTIVHGSISDASAKTVTFHRFRYNKDRHVSEERTMSAKDLSALQAEIDALSSQILALTGRQADDAIENHVG